MGALQLSTVNSFAGGRHLDAIDFCPDLTAPEKSILHCIASQLDFTGDFQEERWMYISTIMMRTSLGRTCVFKALRSLQDRGYLMRRQVVSEQAPRLMASYFRLLPKLFDQHASRLEKLENNKPVSLVDQSTSRTGVVREADGGSPPNERKAPSYNPSYNSNYGKKYERRSHEKSRPTTSMYQALPSRDSYNLTATTPPPAASNEVVGGNRTEFDQRVTIDSQSPETVKMIAGFANLFGMKKGNPK